MATQINLNICGDDHTSIAEVTLVGRTLTITMKDGTRHTVELPADKFLNTGRIHAGKLELTMSDGRNVEVDLQDIYDRLKPTVRSVALEGRTLTVTMTNDQTHTVTLPDDDRGVVKGVLAGSELQLQDAGDHTLSTVDLSSLIPAATADRFLKAVEYVKRNKQLKFTTGTSKTDTTDDESFTVNVADLLPVVAGTGLTGDGTTDTPLAVDLPTLVDNATIKVEGGKLKAEIPPQQGGLDCAAISQLPQKPWSRGTHVLAQDVDGQCFRLQAMDDIFTDVGVAMNANRVAGLTTDEFLITLTVTNSGVNPAPRTVLNLTRPSAPGYTVGQIQRSSHNAGTVNELNPNSWEILNLGAGGSVVLRIPVTGTDNGVYQFGAQVVVDGVDTNKLNNNASIALSIATPADPNINPSVDCPLITATDIATGKRLLVGSPAQQVTDGKVYVGFNAEKDRINMYMADDSLQGKRITLTGAKTVAVWSTKYQVTGPSTETDDVFVNTGGRRTSLIGRSFATFGAITMDSGVIEPSTGFITVGTGGYSFDPDTGELVINADVTTAVILARPQGNNCQWQLIRIAASSAMPAACTVNSPDGIQSRYGKMYRIRPVPATTLAVTGAITHLASGNAHSIAQDLYPTAIINHKKGTTKSYTLNASCDNYFNGHRTQGNVKIEPTNNRTSVVTVNANATASDNVKFKRIEVNIVD